MRIHHAAVGRGSSSVGTMAWRSSGTSNEDLVNQLWQNGLIKDERVKTAFLKVPPTEHIFSHDEYAGTHYFFTYQSS